MLLVILAVAALAILASVVLVSLGKGGELTEFPPDVPPLNLPEAGELAAVDFMALQLPVNLVGYHTQSVDETLRRAAHAISARDTRIAILEQRVSELLSNRLYARQEVYAAPGAGPRTEHEPPAAPLALPLESDPHTNGHIPAASLEEPASAAHEPVTWADPADDPHIPDETTQDTTTPPTGDATPPYAASEDDGTYAALQNDATPYAASGDDATPYAASGDDATRYAASEDDGTSYAALQNDATPYAASEDDATPYAALQNDATPYAASEDDATPYAALQNDTTPYAASHHDAPRYAADQDDATPYAESQDDAERGAAMGDAASEDDAALRRSESDGGGRDHAVLQRSASDDGGRDHAARDDVVRDVTAGDVEGGLLATSPVESAGVAGEPVTDQDGQGQARQRDGAGERVRAAGREDGDGRE